MKKETKTNSNKTDGYTVLCVAYEKVLDLFVSTNVFRDWMMQPFVIGNEILATNSNAIIKLPLQTECNLRGELPKDKNPNGILSVIPKEENANVLLQVPYLKTILSKVEKIDEYTNALNNKKCPECEGEGVVDWEYGSHSKECDCPVCDGEGYIEEKNLIKTGNKIFNENDVIEIIHFSFSLTNIEKLIVTADLLNQKKIKLVTQLPNGTNKFIIGDAVVVIMSMNPSEKYNVVHSF